MNDAWEVKYLISTTNAIQHLEVHSHSSFTGRIYAFKHSHLVEPKVKGQKVPHTYGHFLRALNYTSECRTDSGVIFRFGVNVTSSWWRPQPAKGACLSWSWSPSNLVLSHFSNSRTLVILLQVDPIFVMNLKPFVKVVTRLKTPPSSHGLQFLALDTIVGCVVRFVDSLLIARQTT